MGRAAGALVATCVFFASPAWAEECSPSLPPFGLHAEDARVATAAALETGLEDRDLTDTGLAWLGRMDSVPGRDVLVFVPRDLDRSRTVELVVYLEGFYSFTDRAMDERHAAGIAQLRGRNAVYVAPDAPTSVHGGKPRNPGRYWDACPGGCRGASAPGDFIAFYRDVRALIDATGCQPLGRVELSLIGFSAGGRGVRDATRQLAASREDVRLDTVNLTRIVLADAIYGRAWLEETWDRVKALPGFARLSLLLIPSGHQNRRNAAAFAAAHLPGLRVPARVDAPAEAGRVRVLMIDGGHHDAGNRGVEFVLD